MDIDQVVGAVMLVTVLAAPSWMRHHRYKELRRIGVQEDVARKLARNPYRGR